MTLAQVLQSLPKGAFHMTLGYAAGSFQAGYRAPGASGYSCAQDPDPAQALLKAIGGRKKSAAELDADLLG